MPNHNGDFVTRAYKQMKDRGVKAKSWEELKAASETPKQTARNARYERAGKHWYTWEGFDAKRKTLATYTIRETRNKVYAGLILHNADVSDYVEFWVCTDTYPEAEQEMYRFFLKGTNGISGNNNMIAAIIAKFYHARKSVRSYQH